MVMLINFCLFKFFMFYSYHIFIIVIVMASIPIIDNIAFSLVVSFFNFIGVMKRIPVIKRVIGNIIFL